MSPASQLAGDIALELQAYLRNKFPDLPFGAQRTLYEGCRRDYRLGSWAWHWGPRALRI